MKLRRTRKKRGYAQLYQSDKWRSSFFIIKLQGFFEFAPDWYRQEAVRRTASRYLWKVRSVVREHSHLQPCLKRCRHCTILFLTHPRNIGRNDIACPFGCREVRRKRKSTERSTAYYQTDEGKIKKRQQNRRRGNRRPPPPPEPDQSIIVHLQLVTSLIEGRAVSLSEIFAMLKRILRQHSIGWPKKPVYTSPVLNKTPP